MKKKNSKINSLKTKLTLAMISLCIIPLILLGMISYWESSTILTEKLHTTSAQTLEEISRSLDNYFDVFDKQLTIASKNINLIEINSNQENIDGTYKLLDAIKESNPSIRNVFYGTESNLLITSPKMDLGNLRFKESQWYILANMSKGQFIITDPTLDERTNETVVSVARTIEKDGKVIGVLGFDIKLETLTENIAKSKVGDSGYVFIFSKQGIVVTHPDKAQIGTDMPKNQSFWNDVSANNKGFTTYNYNGINKFGSYLTNDLTNWKLMAALNESEVSNDLNVILLNLTIGILIVAVIGIFISLLISIGITKNIKKLKNVFAHAAAGDLTVSLNIKAKDEIGDLANSFNIMISKISELMKSVKDSSTIMLDACTNIAAVAEETTASVSEVSSAIESIALGSTIQAQSAVDGTSKMNVLSENIEFIAGTILEAEKISNSTEELSNKGLAMIEILTEKSLDTKNSSQEVSDIVQEVHRSMAKITTMSDTISQVSEQTNLLSLNASIEAARAGESGKGFAVVAEEIRKLAEQSKDATENIKSIIQTIQVQSKKAVDSIKTAGNAVTAQEETVVNTEAIFNDILSGVKDLSGKINEITYSTATVNSSKTQVEDNIHDITGISQEIASSSQEVSASTEEVNATMDELSNHAANLTTLAEKLQDGVNKFIV
jgi:methyl-accepting chemotaxis protein